MVTRQPAQLRLIAFYLTSFAIIGAHMPFWPLWLRARGMSADEITWIVTAGIFARTTLPFVAQRVDQIGRPRRVAIFLLALSVIPLSLNAFASSFAALLALHVVFAVTFMSIFPLVDVLAAESGGENFGRLRLWGSASFMVTSFAVGRIVDASSENSILWLTLGALLASCWTAWLLPRRQGTIATTEVQRPGVARDLRGPLRRLLADREFLWFAAGCGIIQASHAGVYGFGSLHWQDVGHDETLIGALWSVGVVTEITLFAFGAQVLRRISPRGLALLGGGAALLRWSVLASTDAAAPLFLAQALHGLTFGATHLGLVTFIQRQLPRGLGVTAQAIYSAVGTGICMAAGSLAAGNLFAAYGGGMFWAMAGVAALGTLCALRRGSS